MQAVIDRVASGSASILGFDFPIGLWRTRVARAWTPWPTSRRPTWGASPWQAGVSASEGIVLSNNSLERTRPPGTPLAEGGLTWRLALQLCPGVGLEAELQSASGPPSGLAAQLERWPENWTGTSCAGTTVGLD